MVIVEASSDVRGPQQPMSNQIDLSAFIGSPRGCQTCISIGLKVGQQMVTHGHNMHSPAKTTSLPIKHCC